MPAVATLPEVLALLVAAHALGAHALRGVLGNSGLLGRSLALAGTYLACLIPVFAGNVLLWTVALTVTFAVLETVANAIRERHGEGLPWVLLPLLGNLGMMALLASPLDWHFEPEHRGLVYTAAVMVSAFAFVTSLGSTIVRAALGPQLGNPTPAEGDDSSRMPPTPGMGQRIGVLERCLALILGLMEAWAGLGLIVAAKSIARFKDLEDRGFAEYYLVGTLCSVFVAIVIALATAWALTFAPVVVPR